MLHYEQHRSRPLTWTSIDGGFQVTHASVYPGDISRKYKQNYNATLRFPVCILIIFLFIYLKLISCYYRGMVVYRCH